MNRPRFDAYSKIILTIIAACLIGLCVDRFTARADAQATQPTTTQPTTVRYDKVEAKAFVLVNDKGEVDGSMATMDGWPFLRLRSVEGKSYVYLDSKGLTFNPLDANGLIFNHKSFVPHIRLGLLEDGMPGLSLYDAEKHLRADLSLSKEGGPALYLRDRKGQTRASLALHEYAGPRLTLADSKRDWATLGATRPRRRSDGLRTGRIGTAPSSLALYDHVGKVTWKAPPRTGAATRSWRAPPD